MSTITGSSIVLTFAVESYSPAPVKIQGYSPDASVDGEALTVGEVLKGIDGFDTSGFYQTVLPTPFELMADSPSIAFIDGWMAFQMNLSGGNGDVVRAINGVVTYPSLGKTFAVNRGTLTNYKPIPAGQRLLRPRPFTITWGQWQPMTQI